jgi:hypothetical protein
MPHADVDACSRVLALAAPPERVALSEWADTHRILSSEASAAPGPRGARSRSSVSRSMPSRPGLPFLKAWVLVDG